MVTKSLTSARVPLVYAVIFALTFLVALWWRSPAGDAHSPVVSVGDHAASSEPLRQTDAMAIATSVATVASVAIEAEKPAMPSVAAASLDESRDTIAGDIYPVVPEHTATAAEAAAVLALSPTVSAAYPLPADHPDHAAREVIPGD